MLGEGRLRMRMIENLNNNSVGEWESRKVPTPEIGKIVEDNWFSLHRGYTFREEAEISEIISKPYVKT